MDVDIYYYFSGSVAQKQHQTKLRRSNSASTLLGLTLLVNPDKEEYGISMNNYEGFRVLSI